jgi:hypothetical protein
MHGGDGSRTGLTVCGLRDPVTLPDGSGDVSVGY